MSDQEAGTLAKPGGFSKWFGRLFGLVLILAAAAVAAAYLTQDGATPASHPPAGGANQGIRLD